MIFSSLLFLFFFMPIFFLLYYIVPYRFKNFVLFVGSIIFYAWGEPKYIVLLLVSILVNYLAGLYIGREGNKYIKPIFVLCICFDILMLMFFKYVNFFIDNISSISGVSMQRVNVTLPLGISFYTFQIMSYVIDLYRGKVKSEKSFVNLGTYLCMFPQLIAGPIVVYSDVAERLQERRIEFNDIEEGLKMFVLGLGSKVLIANNAGMLWDELKVVGYENLTAPMAWLGMLAYTIQIYFDFNGYSMMAIGLGKMLGFEFPKNFDLPYISKSITEYWRRWHMTLSGWFKEYLYIPLGGNRKGTARTYINLFIVWFITGFWHGADWNFILWGLYFYVLLMFEKICFGKILKKSSVLAHLYTILAIGFGWLIFAISNLKELGIYISRLFVGGINGDVLFYVQNYGLILLIGCILSTGIMWRVYDAIKDKFIAIVAYVLIFVLSVAYLADASYNPFLYFRF